MSAANPARGEATIRVAGEALLLRPSFAALVAAEQELGPLFALVERAADGRLGLGEMVALFWHCLAGAPEGLTREAFGENVVAGGIGPGDAGAADAAGADIGGAVSFAESATRLAGFAGAMLGWRPEEFWRATPAELAAIVAALTGERDAPLDAATIADLRKAFPDG